MKKLIAMLLAPCMMLAVFAGCDTYLTLLAYSGGYIALLTVFMAQGTPISHIFNYKYVAAEIIHTVIGSFGLVSVAPFTALCAGMMLARPNVK